MESPRSILAARVDEKGRLDVPADLKEYFDASGITRLFITTPDRRIGRIYPIEVWKSNEQMFLEKRGVPGIKRLAFISRVHGDYGAVDKGGRLLLPAKLREVLGLDQRQTVWLEVHNGVVNLLTQAVYDELLRDAVANNASDLQTAEELGFI